MFPVPRELQKQVLQHLDLAEQQFIGPYLLVDKTWCVWTREINQGRGMMAAHLRNLEQADHYVNVEWTTACDCRSCADHLSCSTGKVEIDLPVTEVVKVTKGLLFNIPVTMDSTAIWIDDYLTIDSLAELTQELRRIKTMAQKHSLVVLVDVDVGHTAVALNLAFGTCLQGADLDDVWHPLRL